jgi:hypothetical protein
MGGIIAHSVMGIEVGRKDSLNLFLHKSNFDILKNKIEKKARKGFRRKKKMPLTVARDKKNRKGKNSGGKRRKVRVEIRQ